MGLQDILFIPTVDNSNILKNVKKNLITKSGEKNSITIGHLITLANDGYFIENGYLHKFLEKCEMELVATPKEPRNPELEARIRKLKAEQENKEYNRMVKGIGSTQQIGSSIRNDVKQVTSQLTAVINFVLSIIGSFFFAYKAVEYALPESNIPAQVLVGIVISIIVALADLFFLARTI